MRGARTFIAVVVLFLPALAATAEPASSGGSTGPFAADSLPTIHPGDVATQTQWRPPPERSSFTWELGVGAGITSVGGDDGAGFVIAPLPRLNLAVVIGGLPAVYGDRFVMGASLGIELQHT